MTVLTAILFHNNAHHYSVSDFCTTFSIQSRKMKAAFQISHNILNCGAPLKSVIHVRNKRSDDMTEIVNELVTEFCHTDEFSRVDSTYNFCKVLNKRTNLFEQHQRRVWDVPTVDDKYKAFVSCNLFEEYQARYPKLTMSRTTFANALCPCTRNPTEESCVDLITTAVLEKMKALCRVLSMRVNYNNNEVVFSKLLEECTCERHAQLKENMETNQELEEKGINWERMLYRRTEDLVVSTCCMPVSHEKLSVLDRVPKFTPFRCIEGTCTGCGVEHKMKLNECPTWNNCTLKVKVMNWREAERSGEKTQKELTEEQMRVPDLLTEFKTDVEAARNHLTESRWSNWMRYIHTADSDQDTCVMLTDFSAIANLRASKTDNSSVDNHAVFTLFCMILEMQPTLMKLEILLQKK